MKKHMEGQEVVVPSSECVCVCMWERVADVERVAAMVVSGSAMWVLNAWNDGRMAWGEEDYD